MTTITTQLVDALRKAQAALDSVAQPRSLQAEALADVDDALVAYDARKPEPPSLAAALRNIAAHDYITGCGPQLDHLFKTWIDGAREALAAYDAQQACGHSACSQNYIDTGSRACVQAGDHTPEPWRASDYATSGGSSGACIMVGDDTVLDLPYGEAWSSEVQDANARRIVACVNACAGIPTASLEAGIVEQGMDALDNYRDVAGPAIPPRV